MSIRMSWKLKGFFFSIQNEHVLDCICCYADNSVFRFPYQHLFNHQVTTILNPLLSRTPGQTHLNIMLTIFKNYAININYYFKTFLDRKVSSTFVISASFSSFIWVDYLLVSLQKIKKEFNKNNKIIQNIGLELFINTTLSCKSAKHKVLLIAIELLWLVTLFVLCCCSNTISLLLVWSHSVTNWELMFFF